MNTDYVEPVRTHPLGFLIGLLIALAVGYAAYHWLWHHGWLGVSSCLLIWYLLLSLYKR
jgi:hypothetical protein